MAAAGRFIDISKAIETCFDKQIPQTPVQITTGNDGWNNLASDFVNGISSELTGDQITSLGNVIFKGANWQDESVNLINSQPWLIVFVSIGAAFSVLTLIGALATCIWACTCRRNSKGIKSQCLNITGIILAFISFGFVVAGIVLYALSTSGFVNGVLTATDPINVVVTNVGNFTTGVTTQVSCSVSTGFSTITDEVTKLPDEVVTQFESTPQVADVIGPNYDAIGQQFAGCDTAVQKIIDDLTAARPKVDAAGQAEIDVALAQYNEIKKAIAPTALPAQLTELGKTIGTFEKNMKTTVETQLTGVVTTATGAMNTMIGEVNTMVNNVMKVINNATDQVTSVLKSVDDFEKELNKNGDVSGWITAGFDSLIIIPCVIALIAALIAFVVGIFFAFQRTSLPSKGCCSASCTLITFSIVVLTIAFIVMVPATLAMTLGYGANLVCQPFFYDEKLTALTAVDSLIGNFDIPTMKQDGSVVHLKFSEIMLSCKAKNTFMQAVKGDQIIDVNEITKAINVDDLTKQTKAAIDGANLPLLDATSFDTLTNAMKSLSDAFLPDLTNAKKADPTDINKISGEMQTLSDSLKTPIDTCNKAAASGKYLSDQANVKTLLEGTSSDFINTLFNDLNTTANQFESDLITKSAPCTPVYQSYEDVGDVACKQMAGGVQGMWAAAGLAALFFLPTVIAVFCVASALRGGKAKKEQLLSVHDEDDPFRLPPMSNSPGVSPSAPQRDDSLPRLTVDTSAAGLAAAPYSESNLATAPIVSASNDPWESSYHNSAAYPYNQPAASTAPFVDPLAYPVAAAAAEAAKGPYVDPLAYDTAGPSAYPRINVTATNRYYDNQSYTPSTLTRF